MSNQPPTLAKYLYWSSATVTSVASLIGLRIFLQSNYKDPIKSTLDFKLACLWQGTRALISIVQIYIHPQLYKFRIGDGKNPNKFQQTAQKIFMKDSTRFGKVVAKCNKWLYRSIFFGSIYCIATYYSEFKKPKENGPGLINTLSNIYIELFNISLWSYVLLYRQVYTNKDLYNSYAGLKSED